MEAFYETMLELVWLLMFDLALSIKVILVCFTVKVFQSRAFEVHGYYLSLSLTMGTSFPWKLVWRSKVPSRVAFFSWTAALGKILTFDNLRKRCIIIVDWCYMCRRSGESVDHLLLHYPIAYEQQTMVWSLFGLHWVMPQRVLDVLASWQGTFGRHHNEAVWIARFIFFFFISII